MSAINSHIASMLGAPCVGNFLLALGNGKHCDGACVTRRADDFIKAWTHVNAQKLFGTPRDNCPICGTNKNVKKGVQIHQEIARILTNLHDSNDPAETLARTLQRTGSRGGSSVSPAMEKALRIVVFTHPEWVDGFTKDAVLHVKSCQEKADAYDWTEYLEQMPLIENMLLSVSLSVKTTRNRRASS